MNSVCAALVFESRRAGVFVLFIGSARPEQEADDDNLLLLLCQAGRVVFSMMIPAFSGAGRVRQARSYGNDLSTGYHICFCSLF
jgi:hypothetical protein